MKLLFDENLSPKLPELLESLYPGSAHVKNCGLNKAGDAEVWEYAKSQGFVIVSKDSDFQDRSMLWGGPTEGYLVANSQLRELGSGRSPEKISRRYSAICVARKRDVPGARQINSLVLHSCPKGYPHRSTQV